MEKPFLVFCVVFLFKWTNSQLLTTFNIPNVPQNGNVFTEGASNRLILTPYLYNGRHDLARKLARVNNSYFLNITSFSGYLTVEEKYKSNLFFWFFPAEGTDDLFVDADFGVGEDENTDFDHEFLKKLSKKPVNEDSQKLLDNVSDNSKPVVLWLQGGPGVSSMFALFTENGPFFVDKETLKLKANPYSWHKNYHILFVDNPVGTGFSFTEANGYCQNMKEVANHLYKGLVQFFVMFPMIKSNDFYITGESFAGKYIPAIGNEIFERNGQKENTLKINLQGLALGNALSDPYNMADYSDFAYQLGLIGLQGYREMKITETLIRLNIDKPNIAKAYWDATLHSFSVHSNYSNLYNIADPHEMDLYPFLGFVDQAHIRNALHVGDQQFSGPGAVYANLVEDFMNTAMHWTERLLNNGLKIMYYNGNWDFIVAYPLSENAFQKMRWNDAEIYRSAKRRPFLVNGKLKGYITKANNFYEVSILNAGHMVPTDQPEACLEMINRFIKNEL